MADLPSVIDKLNDIEIGSGQPLTETLMRRFGSNINAIIDFLGLGPGGGSSDLGDFLTAIDTVRNHTMELVIDFDAAPVSVFKQSPSFVQIPFVENYFVVEFTDFLTDDGDLPRVECGISVDGGPFNLRARENTAGYITETGSPDIGGSGSRLLYDTAVVYENHPIATIEEDSSFFGSSLPDAEPGFIRNGRHLIAKVDWRRGTSFRIQAQARWVGSSSQLRDVKIYRYLKLNVQSTILDIV